MGLVARNSFSSSPSVQVFAGRFPDLNPFFPVTESDTAAAVPSAVIVPSGADKPALLALPALDNVVWLRVHGPS